MLDSNFFFIIFENSVIKRRVFLGAKYPETLMQVKSYLRIFLNVFPSERCNCLQFCLSLSEIHYAKNCFQNFADNEE